MPVIVVLGGPILSLVDAVIVQPPYGLAHRTIGGHGREVSNLDFEVKNPDLTEGRRSRAEATPAAPVRNCSATALRPVAGALPGS
jgi:hypothetical protein